MGIAIGCRTRGICCWGIIGVGAVNYRRRWVIIPRRSHINRTWRES
jgi:hypothetical protein